MRSSVRWRVDAQAGSDDHACTHFVGAVAERRGLVCCGDELRRVGGVEHFGVRALLTCVLGGAETTDVEAWSCLDHLWPLCPTCSSLVRGKSRQQKRALSRLLADAFARRTRVTVDQPQQSPRL